MKHKHIVHALIHELKCCKDLNSGRKLHAQAVQSRTNLSSFAVTALIKMYAKCGSMVDAHSIFASLKKPDVVAWTALLMGYVESGQGLVALDLFHRMKASGCVPDAVTYTAALKACTCLGTSGNGLQLGRGIHSEIGCYLDLHVQNTLIDMYSKYGSMKEAHNVFESINNPDVVSWAALLLGYAEAREGSVALNLFFKMIVDGCLPDHITYLAAFKACSSIASNGDDSSRNYCLQRGSAMHSEIGCKLHYRLQSTVIGMYAKCGSMLDARRTFDKIERPDVVSWTTLLLGYAQNGEGRLALDMFSKMKAQGCAPNSVSHIALLKSCISLAENGDEHTKEECLEMGRTLHSEIGSYLDLNVQNTLVDMYVKCGSMAEARNVFDNIRSPNAVSFTTMILGHVEAGEGHVAMNLFLKMKALTCLPDSVAYVAALRACTVMALSVDGNELEECLERGKELHSEIDRHCQLDHYLQSTLIDMYAKCNSMEHARRVFDTIEKPDVVSWTALILGYADSGEGYIALQLFSVMKERGCSPNCITYVATLKACGCIGALALGRKLHSEIPEFNSQVVTSLVDLYAKCGSMFEAREVFDFHSQTRSVPTWSALLAGYGLLGESAVVFDLFKAMQDEGLQPLAVTFLCLLLCCSHAGLIKKAESYLEEMRVYHVTPTVKHYTCMVDALGRAKQLNKAIAMIQKMPCRPNAVTWMTLLGACRKWKNVEMGRMGFQSLVDSGVKDAASYVLMAHIYGSRNMWKEQERLLTCCD